VNTERRGIVPRRGVAWRFPIQGRRVHCVVLLREAFRMKTRSGVRSTVMYCYGNDARFFTSSPLRDISPRTAGTATTLYFPFRPHALGVSASAVCSKPRRGCDHLHLSLIKSKLRTPQVLILHCLRSLALPVCPCNDSQHATGLRPFPTYSDRPNSLGKSAVSWPYHGGVGQDQAHCTTPVRRGKTPTPRCS
jgi:hypothetical protein